MVAKIAKFYFKLNIQGLLLVLVPLAKCYYSLIWFNSSVLWLIYFKDLTKEYSKIICDSTSFHIFVTDLSMLDMSLNMATTNYTGLQNTMYIIISPIIVFILGHTFYEQF